MSRKFSGDIRDQVMLFQEHLELVYGIKMVEKKEIDWGIKYLVEAKGGNERGRVVIYCNKKGGCSYRFEKNIDIESKNIFAETFKNRNNLQDKSKKKNNKKADTQSNKLKYYYETLSIYRNEEFDFISFAKELFLDLPEEKISNLRYDFSELEKIYQNRLKEAQGYGNCI